MNIDGWLPIKAIGDIVPGTFQGTKSMKFFNGVLKAIKVGGATEGYDMPDGVIPGSGNDKWFIQTEEGFDEIVLPVDYAYVGELGHNSDWTKLAISGRYYSNDGGLTWDSFTNGFDSWTEPLYIEETNQWIIFASFLESNGNGSPGVAIYDADDGSVIKQILWLPRTPMPSGWTTQAITNPNWNNFPYLLRETWATQYTISGTHYIVVTNEGGNMIYSTNNGSTWSALANGFGLSTAVFKTNMCQINDRIAYVSWIYYNSPRVVSSIRFGTKILPGYTNAGNSTYTAIQNLFSDGSGHSDGNWRYIGMMGVSQFSSNEIIVYVQRNRSTFTTYPAMYYLNNIGTNTFGAKQTEDLLDYDSTVAWAKFDYNNKPYLSNRKGIKYVYEKGTLISSIGTSDEYVTDMRLNGLPIVEARMNGEVLFKRQ